MVIGAIKSEVDCKVALKEIERLWHAKPGTVKGNKLEILVTLVETWEDEHYPIKQFE